MIRNKYSIFLLLSILLYQFIISKESFAESYFGSYLFCSSENGLRNNQYWNRKVNWNWSKGYSLNYQKNKIDDKYNNFTFINSSGTWINGFGDISSTSLKHYLLVRNTFENKQEAIQYCKYLEDKCVNEFGSSYKYIGVSSWSIPQTAWGTIAVRYKENFVIKWTTCPNWEFSGFKELHYFPLWQATGLTTFAAAGMIISPWAMGVALGKFGAIAGVIGTSYGFSQGLNTAYNIYNYISEKIYFSHD